MQTPFRSMLLLGAVAVAALVAPASATSRGKAQYADILSNSASFYATLSPLPNTTGVELGGSGACTLYYEPQNGNGANRVNVAASLDPESQGTIVAVHIHKGLPNENGPVALALCASAPPFTNMPVAVEKPGGGKFAAAPTDCGAGNGGQFAGQVLMNPEDGTFDTLQHFFELFLSNPGGFYCNIHTDKSEAIAPDMGLIRGQFAKSS